jgi:hypothetical protein
MNYNLGQTPQGGYQYPSGIGYIVIPYDLDRDTYISTCFRQGRVTIRTEDGGFINRCPISVDLLNWIKFPTDFKTRGSVVTWSLEPIHKQPIINGILLSNEDVSDLKEHEFKLGRKLDDNHALISGSPKAEYLSVTVKGKKAPKLIFRVLNDQNLAQKIEEIQGTYEATYNSKAEIKSLESIKHSIVDQNEEKEVYHLQTIEGNFFRGDKFIINDGKEAMVLGNVLKTFLDKFIDTVAASTVTTSIGQMPLLNAQQIIALKKETESILSEIGKLD